MKTRIVYDSVFGNTEKIAMFILHELSLYEYVKAFPVNNVSLEDLKEIDLLIVGSPTRGFRPTPVINNFLKQIPSDSLCGISVAAFDTRLALNEIKSSALRFTIKTGGYAAKSIAKRLVKTGGRLIIPPEGFYVSVEKGPLLDSEMKHATDWAKSIIRLVSNKISQAVNSRNQ